MRLSLHNMNLSILNFPDAPAEKKDGIRAKVKEYMARAELIKQKVKEDKEGTVTECSILY